MYLSSKNKLFWVYSLYTDKTTFFKHFTGHIFFYRLAGWALLSYFCLGLISPQTPDQYFWKSSTLKGTPSFAKEDNKNIG
jgi:hypothetical protein